jgi:hypothetical protein
MNQVPLDFPLPAPVVSSVRTRGLGAQPGATGSPSLRLAASRPAAGGVSRRLGLRSASHTDRARLAAAHPAVPYEDLATACRPSLQEAVAFEIGWDHAHHGMAPPPAHLHPGHPVRRGWEAGCQCFGARTLRPTSAVRQWLSLRLQAWGDGHSFDSLHVTPHLLIRLQASHCPITRDVLTRGAGDPAESSIVRMDPAIGFTPGNLVVLGRAAARVWDTIGFREAIQRVEEVEADGPAALDGLGAAAWARLAVLRSLVTPLPHDEAARLPLLVLPPPRVPVVNPAQALQVLLTTQLMRAGYARRLADLAGRVTSPTARQALQVFMHTLLARRVALGASPDPLSLRHGLEDAWRHPLVNQRWQAFARAMTPAACERLLRHGVAAGDAVQLAA